MKATTTLALAAALVLGGCDKGAGKVDTAAEEAAIKTKETAWMADYGKRDANALAAQYSDDAAIANPGMALAADTAGRRAMLDEFTSDQALKVDFASDRIMVAASGDLASSRGHYTMTYTDAATKQPKTESGSYLTVYRKGADGKWMAVEDFITPGPGATAETQ